LRNALDRYAGFEFGVNCGGTPGNQVAKIAIQTRVNFIACRPGSRLSAAVERRTEGAPEYG